MAREQEEEGKSAADVSANAGPLIIALAIVTVLLLAALGVLAFRARRARALMSAASQFADIVQSAKYTERVRASTPAMPFAKKANLPIVAVVEIENDGVDGRFNPVLASERRIRCGLLRLDGLSCHALPHVPRPLA